VVLVLEDKKFTSTSCLISNTKQFLSPTFDLHYSEFNFAKKGACITVQASFLLSFVR